MAITLKVEDYCQNCLAFEADVDKNALRRVDYSFTRDDDVIFETTITCEHRHKCAELRKHIERNMKKDDIT